MSEKFRAVFFGTPAFAVPCLDALFEIAEVVAAVCQPDKPKGRGLTLTPPPVKVRATELGIPVTQPTKLRTGDFAEWLRSQKADVALVVAYGRILPADVLAAPRLGCVNVHASLLPKYRGAAPITWAVVYGEKETGVTLMQMDIGMDTGAMLEQFTMAVGPNDTAGEVGEQLSRVGARAVREGLPKYMAGRYTPEAQDHSKATPLAPMLKKEDGRIAWDKTAQQVHDHVRGMSPWPGASTTLNGKLVKVHSTHISDFTRKDALPGTVLLADKTRVIVATGEQGAVELVTIQLEGKKPTAAAQWHLGRGVNEGDRLT